MNNRNRKVFFFLLHPSAHVSIRVSTNEWSSGGSEMLSMVSRWTDYGYKNYQSSVSTANLSFRTLFRNSFSTMSETNSSGAEWKIDREQWMWLGVSSLNERVRFCSIDQIEGNSSATFDWLWMERSNKSLRSRWIRRKCSLTDRRRRPPRYSRLVRRTEMFNQKGLENITMDELVQEITPKRRGEKWTRAILFIPLALTLNSIGLSIRAASVEMRRRQMQRLSDGIRSWPWNEIDMTPLQRGNRQARQMSKKNKRWCHVHRVDDGNGELFGEFEFDDIVIDIRWERKNGECFMSTQQIDIRILTYREDEPLSWLLVSLSLSHSSGTWRKNNFLRDIRPLFDEAIIFQSLVAFHYSSSSCEQWESDFVQRSRRLIRSYSCLNISSELASTFSSCQSSRQESLQIDKSLERYFVDWLYLSDDFNCRFLSRSSESSCRSSTAELVYLLCRRTEYELRWIAWRLGRRESSHGSSGMSRTASKCSPSTSVRSRSNRTNLEEDSRGLDQT